VDTLNTAEIQAFNTTLWGIDPTIAIPFDRKEYKINETARGNPTRHHKKEV
jgi:hypothetical protein